MDDPLLERMKSDRGSLARHMAQIPLFKGYMENNTLWEADRLIRDELTRRLIQVKGQLSEVVRAAAKNVRDSDRLSSLEQATIKIETLANRVRTATYGHSAFFAEVKLKEADLANILSHDRELFDYIESMENLAATLVDSDLKSFEESLSAFEDHFNKRRQLLTCIAETASDTTQGEN